MPEALERKLKVQARYKFPGDKARQDAYVYGTLRRTGWVPSHQRTSKRGVRHSVSAHKRR